MVVADYQTARQQTGNGGQRHDVELQQTQVACHRLFANIFGPQRQRIVFGQVQSLVLVQVGARQARADRQITGLSGTDQIPVFGARAVEIEHLRGQGRFLLGQWVDDVQRYTGGHVSNGKLFNALAQT